MGEQPGTNAHVHEKELDISSIDTESKIKPESNAGSDNHIVPKHAVTVPEAEDKPTLSYASIVSKKPPSNDSKSPRTSEASGPLSRASSTTGDIKPRRLSEGSPSGDQSRSPAPSSLAEEASSSNPSQYGIAPSQPKLCRVSSQPSTYRPSEQAPDSRVKPHKTKPNEDNSYHNNQFNRGKTSLDDAADKDVHHAQHLPNGSTEHAVSSSAPQHNPSSMHRPAKSEPPSFAGLFQAEQRRGTNAGPLPSAPSSNSNRRSGDGAQRNQHTSTDAPFPGSSIPSSRDLQDADAAAASANHSASGRR